jgi:tRNA A-37 threonylcarbamoyl transferase component Bud32
MVDSSNILAEMQVLGNQIPKVDLDCSDSLTKLEVVRVVPGKRVVCKCFWQNGAVYAKIFVGKKSNRYAERDKAGTRLLNDAGIATPPLLAAQKLACADGDVLIYQAIEDCLNTEQAYNSFSALERFNLMCLLVKTIALHHQAGLIQTDCYLKNFLIKGEKIYTLDGDGIKQYAKLSLGQMLENLSVLLSKMNVLDFENWCSKLLENYQSVHFSPQMDAQKIKGLVAKERSDVASKYADNKVFRQCTDVKIISNGNTFIAIGSNYSKLGLPQSITTVDECINAENIIKSGNTCTVATASLNNLSFVIKRYNIKSDFHFFSRVWRPSRAAISWANAHRLIILGLKTAKPVAMLEQRFFGFFRGKAYFLSEYIDAPDIADFFKITTNQKLRSEAVKQTVELFYRLYLLKISHGDMKATNIKVLLDGAPLLIDLDSMQQHHTDFFAKKSHVRDIKRFMRNWKDEPSLYNAFVKVFKVVYADHAPLQAAKILE